MPCGKNRQGRPAAHLNQSRLLYRKNFQIRMGCQFEELNFVPVPHAIGYNSGNFKTFAELSVWEP